MADTQTPTPYFTSEWLLVEEEPVRQFATSTYLNEKHVDMAVSRNNPLGGDLVDGFWMLSMLLYFHFKYVERQSDKEYGFNYGLNKVRFITPVMIGDEVRVTSEFLDEKPHGEGRLITTRNTMHVRGKEKPCMVADLLLLHLKAD
ncbi:hypothetical protein FE848_17350 [Marinobacter sp. 1-3A]|uniref:MaoC/PaaZ C-terminal domain-containing protein n=1 Tax=Marinobacter sp. 1-3A TaxID=2582920 RepID=UPI0019077EA6|nr:MaoC/PaaZ C-terminal domain-containing protein [Marinobacter sp. 1-3A]MBK1874993.1 hypothetical protein [Marinobacter sp. 1-3A]